MDINTKVKGKLVVYGRADISVAYFGNSFFELSKKGIKDTLFGFDYDISKKYILVGVSTTSIDLPNGTYIAQLKNPTTQSRQKFTPLHSTGP